MGNNVLKDEQQTCGGLQDQRRIHMRKYKIIITIALIFIIAFSITGTVQSKNERKISLNNPYEEEQEKLYVAQIKEQLTQMGYEYAGVMLTKTVSSEGKVYQLAIHHRAIERMTQVEQNKLMRQLQKIELMENEYLVETKFIG